MPEDTSTARILSVISFSATGAALARHLKESMPGQEMRLYGKYEDEAPPVESTAAWTAQRMAEKDALLFIGAAGIAVRSIAPHLQSKLTDAPVLVMDELGRHVIPLLSGHVGGANALARQIASAIGADPVITTATDLHEHFAVDVFAERWHLRIANKNGIAPVSSKVLRGETVTLAARDGCISEEALADLPEDVQVVPCGGEKPDILITPEDDPDGAVIRLVPKPYVIGIGCRRGKEAEAIAAFVDGILAEHHIDIREVRAVASIDVKKDEEGILAYCRKRRLPFIVFSAEELEAAPGEYEESAFVRETVGVGNVCERAAALAARNVSKGTYRFVTKKRRGDGVTCAVARWI